MTVSNKTTTKVHLASVILFLIAAACAILIGVNLLTYALEVSALTVQLEPNSNPEPSESRHPDPVSPSASKKLADALKQKDLFQPPPPKPQPPQEAQGILGDQALIAGKWYKVGDTVPPGAKVLKIEAAKVTLDWEGKEMVLAPINAASAPPPAKEPEKKPEMKAMGSRGERPRLSAPVPPPAAGAEDDLAWLDLPAHLKEKFRKMWNMMPPDQKQKAKEEWNKMPEEQKQQAINAMANMPG